MFIRDISFDEETKIRGGSELSSIEISGTVHGPDTSSKWSEFVARAAAESQIKINVVRRVIRNPRTGRELPEGHQISLPQLRNCARSHFIAMVRKIYGGNVRTLRWSRMRAQRCIDNALEDRLVSDEEHELAKKHLRHVCASSALRVVAQHYREHMSTTSRGSLVHGNDDHNYSRIAENELNVLTRRGCTNFTVCVVNYIIFQICFILIII